MDQKTMAPREWFDGHRETDYPTAIKGRKTHQSNNVAVIIGSGSWQMMSMELHLDS